MEDHQGQVMDLVMKGRVLCLAMDCIVMEDLKPVDFRMIVSFVQHYYPPAAVVVPTASFRDLPVVHVLLQLMKKLTEVVV